MVPRYQDAFLLVKPFYSKSKSFLKIHSVRGELSCNYTHDMQVDYIIQRTELQKDAEQMDLHYLVMFWKHIFLQGSFSIQFPTSPDMAPLAKVMVYTMFQDGEVTAATTSLHVSKCFKNKVTLGFSTEEALPGTDISLQLHSAAGSLCAVRAMDKSTVLMKPEKELTNNKVYDMIRRGNFGGYPYQVADAEQGCPGWRRRRSFVPWLSSRDPDVYSLVQRVWDSHSACHRPRHHHRLGHWCLLSGGYRFWDVFPIDTEDFQAVLVELSLPYSVVWDETFTLKATVFNYLKHPIKIQTKLLKSEEFTVEPHPSSQYNLCLGASEGKTFYWLVTALNGEVRGALLCENKINIGDIMGTALQNIDQLLAMPYGCGEQNMVKFAPNIYMMQYLAKTNQMTPEIKEKAVGYLKSGELAAFVMKSFGQAQDYIYVNKLYIKQAIQYLKKHQLESACFKSSGKLFNNARKVLNAP
ncbi:hypothetical protein NDU88_000739 [Pleurodeles waltl]|uniref:Alpha-2-macroglobulin bait region domain-containing protein n=1 Tax=Pleurodeles waltl TaxID=8319 RepID=A0AAV7P4R9_PLEWA|nr:hypothetical protein NDU88_000739 [Pleurodeles waltl]